MASFEKGKAVGAGDCSAEEVTPGRWALDAYAAARQSGIAPFQSIDVAGGGWSAVIFALVPLL
jgi:hypothetical protein